MDLNKLAIATITLARDEEEEQLLRESLAILAGLNLPVYITDGGSKASFIEWLESFSNFHLQPPSKGVWMQAKQSISVAAKSGREFLFYTEPDKKEFLSNNLLNMLTNIHADDRTGVILASRSAEAFSTFPAFQQMSETTINNCCFEVTGKQLDYIYGPFVLNSKLVPYLQDLPQAIDWGWRPYVFNIAKRLNYSISSFTGDFYCPPAQRKDDHTERLYRMKQLHQNIEGLLLSSSAQLL
jgi:hypothetical protein